MSGRNYNTSIFVVAKERSSGSDKSGGQILKVLRLSKKYQIIQLCCWPINKDEVSFRPPSQKGWHRCFAPGLKVIKLEYSLKLKIKSNDWLLADTCTQAANHCTLF